MSLYIRSQSIPEVEQQWVLCVELTGQWCVCVFLCCVWGYVLNLAYGWLWGQGERAALTWGSLQSEVAWSKS